VLQPCSVKYLHFGNAAVRENTNASSNRVAPHFAGSCVGAEIAEVACLSARRGCRRRWVGRCQRLEETESGAFTGVGGLAEKSRSRPSRVVRMPGRWVTMGSR
jgi:hypothetical protein